MIGDDLDGAGALRAAEQLGARLARVLEERPEPAPGTRPALSPPFASARDRYEGLYPGRSTLVIFAAFGPRSSHPLGALIAHVREHHPDTCVAWRHYADPGAHPRAVQLALAAEAAGAAARFWPLTRQLLALRHDGPDDLHGALLRAGLDPGHTVEAISAGVGADRIADDLASAVASGVTVSPTLFVNGERYRGELRPAMVVAALDAAATPA